MLVNSQKLFANFVMFVYFTKNGNHKIILNLETYICFSNAYCGFKPLALTIVGRGKGEGGVETKRVVCRSD